MVFRKGGVWSEWSLFLLLKCCFTSTETVGLLGTGAQDGHLPVDTAPELWKGEVSKHGA